MPPLSRGLSCLRASVYRQITQQQIWSRGIAVGRSNLFRVAEEVQDALARRLPVVALESTIYTHGYPYPENIALSSHLESLVRVNGGVPATIGIINGISYVGMQPEQLIELLSSAGNKDTWKVSRRDLGFLAGFGLRGQKLHGGTTIAGTMLLAHLAGIKVFATGGLGGVHRGGENSMDVSADLTELGRTPVAVISSGCKSFLDIPRTLEYLETQGVGVGTFADGRQGQVDFPAFFSRNSGVPSPRVLQNEADAAAVVYAQSQLPIHSGLLFANPVPEEAAMAREDVDGIIATAVQEATDNGIGGAANTPYILKRIRELSNGASIKANRALIESNVIRGTKVAVELAKLEQQDKSARNGLFSGEPRDTISLPSEVSDRLENIKTGDENHQSTAPVKPVDLFVAGSLAADTMCDYMPLESIADNLSPVLMTSNPANISQAAGGVGRNVAMAAHLAGANVALASVVANDIAGMSLLDQIAKSGMSTSHIRQLNISEGHRTAQYVAVNDVKKDLVMAMADMSIFLAPELESRQYWNDSMQKAKPNWSVVDGNWSPKIVAAILASARSNNIPVAFEPVSTAKAARFFHKDNTSFDPSSVVPKNVISLASPNVLELNAMHTIARDRGFFESEPWWEVIDNCGLSSAGSRDKMTALTSSQLYEQGIPQQSVQLLPFIPNLIVKLGSQGCLLTQLLRPGDPKLTDPASAPFVIGRNLNDQSIIGGVYMRLFPTSREVPQSEIVSVNGIGDTMLGVIMAGLVKGLPTESVIPVAQDAAILSLKSKQAVSSEIRKIADQLR